MNRSFLEELGLEKETINAVMAKHGSTVNDLQDTVKTLEKEKEQLDERISQYEGQLDDLKDNSGDDELKSQIEDLKAANEQLKTEKSEELTQMQHQHKVALTVKDLGVKDEEYISSKLNDLELKDGELVGLDDRVNELKEKHPLLFESEEAPEPSEPSQPKKWSQGGVSQTMGDGKVTREQFNQMTFTERAELAQNDPNTFNSLTKGE